MGPPLVIPGYYFDAEKGKYFKIVKTHVAPPSQAKYTLDNVRKEQKKAKAEKFAKKQQESVEKGRILRPHIRGKWGPHMADLYREMGRERKTYYTHRIWPNACMAGTEKIRAVVGKPKQGTIRFFDRDSNTKTLYAVHGDNTIKRRRQNRSSHMPIPSSDTDDDLAASSLLSGSRFGPSTAESLCEYSSEPWDTLGMLTSSISSLVCLPSSGALAATTLGSDRPPVVSLSDPDKDGPYVSEQFTPKNCSTIWGAAVPWSSCKSNSVPQSGTESLAVAASSGLLLFERPHSGEWNFSVALERDSDVLALDWLSPTTIVFGERSGKITLYDTRSKGCSHILTNPYPIAKIKRADDPTRLLCAGVQDTLFLFDIRSRNTYSKHARGYYDDKFFSDRYPGPRNRQKRKHMKYSVATNNWSQPIMSFPYNNAHDYSLDMAFQPDLGLVAAAQDDNATAAIKIYNSWTGKVLKEIPRQSPNQSPIRCLRFMEDRNNHPELWSSWDGSIIKMSLG